MFKKSLPHRKNLRLKEYDNVGVDALIDPKKIKLSKTHNCEIILTPIGKIIKKYINNFNKNDDIKICPYIIMPNHIHFIIELINNGSMRASTPTIPQIIKTLKSLSTREIGYSIWQRNYYEHIIRNEKELYKIIEYIENNPYNWINDPNYIKQT